MQNYFVFENKFSSKIPDLSSLKEICKDGYIYTDVLNLMQYHLFTQLPCDMKGHYEPFW
jgi:hypothetical protein